jgi:multicomponent Na+:H+ antiporter subunit F
MTWVVVAALALLGVSAIIVLARLYRGPSNLDRIVAAEILLVILVSGVALESARQKTATYLPLLMVLGLVTFVGGVAVTRFLSRDTDETAGTDEATDTGTGNDRPDNDRPDNDRPGNDSPDNDSPENRRHR